MNEKVIVIAGPTAVGKTAYSIELAKKMNTEIVSADSMQIYKYMDIGTAKPTKEEMQGIPHHMIDIVEPTQNYSVADYKRDAYKALDEIIAKGKTPIVVGGTGLYINALIYNIKFTEAENDFEYRKELENIAKEKGVEYLYEKLKEIDEDSASKIYSTDLKRIVRALEIYKITGKNMTYHNEQSRKDPPPYDFEMKVLEMDRAKLYERIDKRVDIMMEQGLVDEVKKILAMGVTMDNTSMQGIGYKEIAQALNGEMTLDEAVDRIKQGSRNYAKRQITWFKKYAG